jgi:glycosyltransferase involved in cell wall biosynthesis
MVEQLRDLRDRYGYEVAAVISEGPGPLLDQLQVNSIPTHHWDFNPIGKATDVLGRLLRLGLLIRRERFDVVHCHSYQYSLIMCRLAAWLFDAPVRVSMISHPAHLEVPTSRWIEERTCWMDTALAASCKLTRLLYRELGVEDERLHLIYYGPDASRFDPERIAPIDLRREYGWGPETRLIGNVAYFYWLSTDSKWTPPGLKSGGYKGQEDIIRAVPLVLSEFPHARFLLIGSAPGEECQRFLNSMKGLVKDLGLEGKVVFPGYRRDSPGIIRTLDVSIQAALIENLGGTVESLLLGRPVVATRAGGMGDSVRDGETGVLVEPANPVSMAEGILRLLRNPEGAEQLGKAGRRFMLERFTLTQTITDLDALYMKQLHGGGRHRPSYRLWVTLWRAPIFMLIYLRLWLRVFASVSLAARGRGLLNRILGAVRRPILLKRGE